MAIYANGVVISYLSHKTTSIATLYVNGNLLMGTPPQFVGFYGGEETDYSSSGTNTFARMNQNLGTVASDVTIGVNKRRKVGGTEDGFLYSIAHNSEFLKISPEATSSAIVTAGYPYWDEQAGTLSNGLIFSYGGRGISNGTRYYQLCRTSITGTNLGVTSVNIKSTYGASATLCPRVGGGALALHLGYAGINADGTLTSSGSGGKLTSKYHSAAIPYLSDNRIVDYGGYCSPPKSETQWKFTDIRNATNGEAVSTAIALSATGFRMSGGRADAFGLIAGGVYPSTANGGGSASTTSIKTDIYGSTIATSSYMASSGFQKYRPIAGGM